jgi:acetyl-CoA C-acetyltransferase
MYILDIKRTAIGKFLGTTNSFSTVDLSVPILKYFLSRYPFLKDRTSEVIVGNVLSAGLGMNLARNISIKAGISKKSFAYTLNYVCGSGLMSVVNGYNSMLLKKSDIVIAGGAESMSNAPFLSFEARKGQKYGHQIFTDSIIQDGLLCSVTGQMMGQIAENIAKKYKVSRESQDEYSLNSHKKAIKAQKYGFFEDEIIPLNIKYKDINSEFLVDEQPRNDTSFEKLKKLNPIFKKSGTITAGNSSTLADGSSFCVLINEKILSKYNLKPIAKIIDYNCLGLEPSLMGIGPYYSINALLKKNNLKKNDIDLFEINEAFAAQLISVIRLLGIDENKVNVNGGAIALGHPLGASGTRILTTLIHSLKRKKLKFGVASLCVGGGLSISLLIEKL